ncbi:hypothetical protein, partial [Actinomycetospora corticicola]
MRRARPGHSPRITVAQLLAAQLEDEEAPTTRFPAPVAAGRIPGARAGSGPLPAVTAQALEAAATTTTASAPPTRRHATRPTPGPRRADRTGRPARHAVA